MYWKENIWKAENSFSSSIKTNWIGELRSFSLFAEEPTKTFTSLIFFDHFQMTKLWPCWFVFDDLLKSDLVGWLIWKIAKQTKCWPSWSFWWFADEAKRNLELTSLCLPVWLSRMAGSCFCKHSVPKELFAIFRIYKLDQILVKTFFIINEF